LLQKASETSPAFYFVAAPLVSLLSILALDLLIRFLIPAGTYKIDDKKKDFPILFFAAVLLVFFARGKLSGALKYNDGVITSEPRLDKYSASGVYSTIRAVREMDFSQYGEMFKNMNNMIQDINSMTAAQTRNYDVSNISQSRYIFENDVRKARRQPYDARVAGEAVSDENMDAFLRQAKKELEEIKKREGLTD